MNDVEDYELYSVNESNCCTALIYEDTDICSRCKEHCDIAEYDEDDEDED